MRKLLLLLVLIYSPCFGESFANFEDFLAKYERAAVMEREELAKSFVKWQQSRGGFPIIEQNGQALFFYLGTGNEKDVRLVGDFRTRNFYNVYWDEQGEAMSRITPDAPLFYKRLKFETDARLDYKFFVDGKYITDPLNPRIIESGTAPTSQEEPLAKASQLVMPNYVLPESEQDSTVPQGKLLVLEEEWAKPKVTIYLPPDYDGSKRYSVLYTADGSAWINFVKLPATLDRLIADRRIEPILAVMIDSSEDRRSWYYYNPQYLSYLEKVVHYIDSHYSTKATPETRLHAGSSAGGSITLYVGLQRPDLFRNLAMLSPSLTGPPHFYEPYFSGRKRPDAKLKLWLSAGTYEGYIHSDAMTMEKYFKSVRLKSKAVYSHEGHSFGQWRRMAAEMLKYFYGLTRGR